MIPHMRLYIDESGDTGMNLRKEGTSRHFVLAAVLVQSAADLDRCVAGVEAFKAERSIRRGEFRFNRCDRHLRAEYLACAATLPWRYLAVVIDKSSFARAVAQPGESLYSLAVNLLLETARPFLQQAILVFDSCGSREFRRTMSPYCKKRTRRVDGSDVIKRVLAQASHSDPMLQLADMVVGAVARSLKPGATDSRTYLRLIGSRHLATRAWPPVPQK